MLSVLSILKEYYPVKNKFQACLLMKKVSTRLVLVLDEGHWLSSMLVSCTSN